MNAYFYKLWIPLQLLTVYFGYRLFQGTVDLNWIVILVSWILMGPIGIGVGYHRLFSHRQFKTSRIGEVVLMTLGTLSGYAPIVFWCTTHIFHHKNSDQPEDLSSPSQYGVFESFLVWRMREKALANVYLFNYCARQLFKDPLIKFVNRHFFKIFWLNATLFFLINENWFVSAILIPVQIEHMRINLISSLSHINFPFSYRNFATADRSQNNLVLGFLSLGFAWHNNHHHNERSPYLRHRWWEFDFEGLVVRLIQRKN